MRVDYLAVCRANCDLEALLFDAMRAGYLYFRSDSEPSDDELRDQIAFRTAKPCEGDPHEKAEEKQWLRAFSIEPDVDEENEERFLLEFHDGIGGPNEGLMHLVKLYDSHLRRVRAKYADEIFEVEMKLREALSLILLDAHPFAPYDLLALSEIKFPGDKPSADELEKRRENELFFLLFSDYTKINSRKVPVWNNFLALAEEFDDWRLLKAQMLRSAVSNKRHTDFIASLQQNTDPIEKVRNCVAHNRSIPQRLADNYQQSYPKLLATIDAFLASEADSYNHSSGSEDIEKED